jgi:toxin ParE2
VIRFTIHEVAEAEYEAAVAWYKAIDESLAVDLRAEVVRVFSSIRQHPQMGEPTENENCRRRLLKRFPYKVIFYSDDAEILILALAHNSRRPGYWRNRLE